MTAKELQDRQLRYTQLAAYFGATNQAAGWRASSSAFDLHKQIVRILDGLEPWPEGIPA